MKKILFECSPLVINVVNEAKTNVLDFLEREFGKDRVFSIVPNEQFTKALYKRIFRVLNATLFGNKLSPTMTYECTNIEFHTILKRLNRDDYLEYYAAYIPQFSHNKKEVERETLFMMNDHGKMTFMFMVNAICHELIHQYDSHFGDLTVAVKQDKYIKGLEHKTKTFLQLMTLANMQGIKVMVTGRGTPFDILNQEAVQFTLNLQEDDGHNWVKYYIDRIKNGNIKGIENMAIAPNGNLCLILT